MNNLKISIVTATYNSHATVRDTLESVLRQKYSNVEHIIVDGASNDGTLALIKEFEPLYTGTGKTLRWISEKDNGIYDAMNKGIAMATGDVVGLLNSDDFFTSGDILTMVAEEFGKSERGMQSAVQDECSRYPVDAVYGDVHYVNPDNLDRCVRYYSSRGFRRWKMRMGFMPAHPSFYCRREIYSRYGMFDTTYRIAADFEQLLRLIFIHRITIRYIPHDFVTMRTGGASSSGLSSHRRIYAEHRRAYRKNKVHSNVILEGCRYVSKIIEVGRSRLARRLS